MKKFMVRFFSKPTSALPHIKGKTKGYFDNSPPNMRLKHRCLWDKLLLSRAYPIVVKLKNLNYINNFLVKKGC